MIEPNETIHLNIDEFQEIMEEKRKIEEQRDCYKELLEDLIENVEGILEDLKKDKKKI